MVEITELPPQRDPRKETARRPSKTLKQHLEGFMNANNLNGFMEETNGELPADSIGGVLLEVMASPGMTVGQIYALGERMKYLSGRSMGGPGWGIRPIVARDLIVKALGYKNENDAYGANKNRKFCLLNIGDKRTNLKMYSDEVCIGAVPIPNPSIVSSTLYSNEPLSEKEYYLRSFILRHKGSKLTPMQRVEYMLRTKSIEEIRRQVDTIERAGHYYASLSELVDVADLLEVPTVL